MLNNPKQQKLQMLQNKKIVLLAVMLKAKNLSLKPLNKKTFGLKGSEKGFTTLTAMLVTISLLSGVILSYGLMASLMSRNELYRREIVLSRNVLLSYDTYLFNHFGLLAYSRDTLDFKGLAASQFEEQKYAGVTHQLVAVATLATASELLTQVRQVTSIRVVNDVVKNQEGLQQALDSVTPLVGHLKTVGQSPSRPEGAKEKITAGERKQLDNYKQKMKKMKNTMKENGMAIEGEKASGQGLVTWKAVKINSDRKATLVEKGFLITYIMGVFSDRVVSKKGELTFYQTDKRYSLMEKGEIEYVLVGSQSQQWNCKVVAGEIFAIRTGIHMKAVMMDRPLMAQLTEESIALAALLPVLPQPTILMSLVAAEAADRASKDLAKLLNGEGVEIFSGVSKWLYYDDYLAFLLWAHSDTKLLERMMTLIAMAYKGDCGAELNFEQMVLRHRIESVFHRKAILKVEEGYCEIKEQGAQWSTEAP